LRPVAKRNADEADMHLCIPCVMAISVEVKADARSLVEEYLTDKHKRTHIKEIKAVQAGTRARTWHDDQVTSSTRYQVVVTGKGRLESAGNFNSKRGKPLADISTLEGCQACNFEGQMGTYLLKKHPDDEGKKHPDLDVEMRVVTEMSRDEFLLLPGQSATASHSQDMFDVLQQRVFGLRPKQQRPLGFFNLPGESEIAAAIANQKVLGESKAAAALVEQKDVDEDDV
jgi:hypothetical protein